MADVSMTTITNLTFSITFSRHQASPQPIGTIVEIISLLSFIWHLNLYRSMPPITLNADQLMIRKWLLYYHHKMFRNLNSNIIHLINEQVKDTESHLINYNENLT